MNIASFKLIFMKVPWISPSKSTVTLVFPRSFDGGTHRFTSPCCVHSTWSFFLFGILQIPRYFLFTISQDFVQISTRGIKPKPTKPDQITYKNVVVSIVHQPIFDWFFFHEVNQRGLLPGPNPLTSQISQKTPIKPM